MTRMNEDAIDSALKIVAEKIDPNGGGAEEFARLLSAERARRDIPMKDGQYIPANVDQVWRLATMCVESGIVPSGVKSPHQMFILLSAGFEAGLKLGQILKGMMIVNNVPAVWGDVAIGMVQASGIYVNQSSSYDPESKTATYTLRTMRSGQMEETTRTFSWADAVTAKLTNKDVWQKYPARMLFNRARAFALRDGAADVLVGLSLVEEVQDWTVEIPSSAPVPQTPATRAEQVAERMKQRAGAGAESAGPEPEQQPAAGSEPSADAGPQKPTTGPEQSGSDFMASLEPSPEQRLEKARTTKGGKQTQQTIGGDA